MKGLTSITDYLSRYDGPPITLMEVCASHTAAIEKHGIRSLLSQNIRLISGPGCPVCVTPTAYIDRLISLAMEEKTCVVTFSDMLRVPGSSLSLSEAKLKGAHVTDVYSPMGAVSLARENPDKNYIFAAVGFETTAPVYTFMLEEAEKENIRNLKFLTAVKTMPDAIRFLLEAKDKIDGFIAPGHVCAVTGADYFSDIADKYKTPFCVAGFNPKELLLAIYCLAKMTETGEYGVKNCYTSVVEDRLKKENLDRLYRFFDSTDAVWRGIGEIKGSALTLNKKYAEKYDAGSNGLTDDNIRSNGCICGQILTGRSVPTDCPLFMNTCTPAKPVGACMVSTEGSCRTKALYMNQ